MNFGSSDEEASGGSSFDPRHPLDGERKRSRRIAGLSIKLPRTPRPPSMPSVVGSVRCTDFGALRHDRYSGYWFCNHCRLYEDALLSGTGSRIDPNGRRYRCQANHDPQSLFPTCTASPLEKDDDDDSMPSLDPPKCTDLPQVRDVDDNSMPGLSPPN